ncbi:ATP-binding protein, partial [Hallerella sp.]|uniref:AlbA family DNA-binding domain-containing protein n=1 Tax=Hallerella sp. TaxID=2815812 RepID=UPI002589134C
HRKPGYLFLGVTDDGNVQGIDVTDAILKNVAAIRTDGNIQPQPSMTVKKVSMDEGDIVMVKVEPSIFPPVRYKGRIWVRIGSRKGVANENDEHILMEKRRANVTSFDFASCRGKMRHRAEDLLLLAPQDSGLPSRGLSDEKTCVPCGRFLRISGVCPCCLKAYSHFFRIKSIFTLDVNNHND